MILEGWIAQTRPAIDVLAPRPRDKLNQIWSESSQDRCRCHFKVPFFAVLDYVVYQMGSENC